MGMVGLFETHMRPRNAATDAEERESFTSQIATLRSAQAHLATLFRARVPPVRLCRRTRNNPFILIVAGLLMVPGISVIVAVANGNTGFIERFRNEGINMYSQAHYQVNGRTSLNNPFSIGSMDNAKESYIYKSDKFRHLRPDPQTPTPPRNSPRARHGATHLSHTHTSALGANCFLVIITPASRGEARARVGCRIQGSSSSSATAAIEMPWQRYSVREGGPPRSSPSCVPRIDVEP
ncbi:MAG: hypothetical protein WDW36_007113 [Sanguina aurantia]